MRSLKFLAILTALFSVIRISAQDDKSLAIEGIVIDAQTNKPIPQASVFRYKSTDTVKTNKEGVFSFTLPEPGFYVISATAPGFNQSSAEEQLITYDKRNKITISLESIADQIGEVNIRRSSL